MPGNRRKPSSTDDRSAGPEADFDKIEASLRRANALASTLRDNITKGITNGTVEAQGIGHCVKRSEVDKYRLIKTFLNNIMNHEQESCVLPRYGPHWLSSTI